MILSGELLANGGFHESRERGKDVDGWVNLSVVKLSIDSDLTLSDVAGQIGNRVGNVCTK